MQLARDAFGSYLLSLQMEWTIAWRVYRIRHNVGPQATGRMVKQSVEIAKLTPFVLLGIAWASTRIYDGQIVQAIIRTKERYFIDEPVLLDGIGSRTSEGNDLVLLPPARLDGATELIVEVERLINVDPWEVYPGADQDSVIDFAFHGVDLVGRAEGKGK